MGESFSIQAEEALPAGIERVLRERVAAALDGLEDRSSSVATKVHEARKRLKELRAGLRLVRPVMDAETFTSENAGLRDIGRPLSDARDAEVMVETLASLKKHFREELASEAFGTIRQALQKRRRTVVASEDDAADALAAAAEHLRATAARLSDWGLGDAHWPALADGLQRCYRKGRVALADASDDGRDDALHEWRKRVKDLRYQFTMLQPLWPAVMKTLVSEAHALGNDLGDDHDLAVLSDLLRGELRGVSSKADRQALEALIARRRETLQKHAWVLGARVYAEKPGRFVGRLDAYWRAGE